MFSFPSFEPVHCSMSGSNYCFLTCIQVSQEAVKVVCYPHLFKNFPQFVVIHTVKWKKSHDQPRQHIKSRDITLLTKVHLVKAMVFPVVMYWCESWIIKKAECWRIDAFELWCWRRLLRVSWTTNRSNRSILKGINPEYSLEGLMLKLQYFGHLMWRANALKKTLMLAKIENKRRG